MLDQYTRGKIHGFITANPGAHYTVIKTTLKLNNGTLAYHLKKLEKEGYVQSRRDGIYKRFFPSGYSPNGTLFSTLQETIIEHLVDHPGSSKKEIAKTLDKSPQVLDYHLRWMCRQDILNMKREGKINRYFLDKGAKAHVASEGTDD